MNLQDLYEKSLCKKCYIKAFGLKKKEIEKIVLSYEQCECDNCGKHDNIVEYVED